MICSFVTPLTKAPNAATPIAPPTCRAVFSTAEAVPDLPRSTLDKIAVVIAGTASPIPAGMRMKPGSISINVDRAPQPREQTVSDSADESAEDHWRTRTDSARHPA